MGKQACHFGHKDYLSAQGLMSCICASSHRAHHLKYLTEGVSRSESRCIHVSIESLFYSETDMIHVSPWHGLKKLCETRRHLQTCTGKSVLSSTRIIFGTEDDFRLFWKRTEQVRIALREQILY